MQKAIDAAPARIERPRELTRQHAANWAVGSMIFGLCAVVFLYVLARAAGLPLQSDVLLYALPLPVLIGLAVGALKLIRFTEEHRNWLYQVETWTHTDLDGDGRVGDPQAGKIEPGTMLHGISGGYQRFDVQLTRQEIEAVKRLLLTEGKATVRGLTGVIGDRASALRTELIRLGVCVSPENDRAPALLSEPGKKAVMRW